MRTDREGASGALWQWGLLVSTVAMGVALLGTGVSGYIRAERSAEMSAAAETAALLRGLHRELGRRGGTAAGLADLIREGAEDGITAAAILSPSGEVVGTAGVPRQPFDNAFLRARTDRPGDGPRIRLFDDGTVHGVARGRIFGRHPGRGDPGRGPRRGPKPGPLIAVETVSNSAKAIRRDGLIAMGVSAGAAVLLLSVALLFFRQKNLADRRDRAVAAERREMALRLERDERLKALGRMSAVLGHELRNPIAALKGHAQLLLEGLPRTDPSRERAETVVREAELLETLTQQVLAFVRTGMLHSSKVYVDDLVESAAALSDEGRIQVIAPEGVTWILDRPRTEQALVNLLSNAVQASPPGRPVELVAEPDGEILRIRVRDFGDGIAPEDLERIFQPFVTGRAQGTGLGLALVQRTAEAHGGSVYAENAPEGGAVFTLEIPMGHTADREATNG